MAVQLTVVLQRTAAMLPSGLAIRSTALTWSVLALLRIQMCCEPFTYGCISVFALQPSQSIG